MSFPRMHVSLYVSNLENTINFYSAFFNMEPNKVKQGYAKYILEEPSLIISFVENKERVNANFGHLGFQVDRPSELNRRLDRAKNLGLVKKEEIGTSCCYAVQDKFWVNDPDDYQWEVYFFHKDAEFNDPKFTVDSTDACCIPNTTSNQVKDNSLIKIKF